ncbi:50S ribosomal protein L25/general stress protein Ctc [Tessaracoccus sp. OH4464_COT-324]|uniref:50S ribosomal protein L25/general stress protein Ctc n=1 Tax=Tessaracoccus sp. OH4464_COT-324 TaxID=2491059 RepID=UPI000F6329A0|nr:50S ribosomal protein L25/general stress protein Ctc [Tessaracoccus sp. OH4464_COT-324]RRD45255.1 50S ribosomal protein L25/general stress protein Ctc [Tessaracoccus sp. OH4464_COT-324]
MADFQIKATKRTEFGKGAARRARRDNLTPAVVYGHGMDTMHLLLPAKELYLALRTANALFELEVEGEAKPMLVLPKQIQRDPILPVVEHVDFMIVKAGEKVSVEVPLVVVGNPEPGLLVNQDINTITLMAPATDIPTEVEVSVEGLELGATVVAADVKLPKGASIDLDGETLVVSIVAPAAQDLPEEAEGEEAAE